MTEITQSPGSPGIPRMMHAMRIQETGAINEHFHGLVADLDYTRQLWMEKSIQSVANVTRDDVRQMLQLAAQPGFSTVVKEYPLHEAGLALQTIKSGDIRSTAVLKIR